MGQFYTDPSRVGLTCALPDAEVFFAKEGEFLLGPDQEYAEPCSAGWYYWYCLPGCLPDSDPYGPFETEEEAIADAREQAGDF
jgi:hypothetical protein